MAPPRVLIHSDSTPLGFVARAQRSDCRKIAISLIDPATSPEVLALQSKVNFLSVLEDNRGFVVNAVLFARLLKVFIVF